MELPPPPPPPEDIDEPPPPPPVDVPPPVVPPPLIDLPAFEGPCTAITAQVKETPRAQTQTPRAPGPDHAGELQVAQRPHRRGHRRMLSVGFAPPERGGSRGGDHHGRRRRQGGRDQVTQSSGFPRLDAAVECVVRRLPFEPGKRDGQPVDSQVSVPIVFKLEVDAAHIVRDRTGARPSRSGVELSGNVFSVRGIAEWLVKPVVTDNPYGIEALWTQSDYVGKGVFVILITMSLWSWLVMINKWLDQRMLRKVAVEAEKSFLTAGSMQEGIAKLKGKINPFRDIAQDGLQRSSIIARPRRATSRATSSSVTWVESHIRRRTDMLQSSLQSGMVVLASVGATSPFVGLFGTVWGIYHALISISIAGQASLDKVAGPIGEALIMTAMGLAVAVPAVLGFNGLLRGNKSLMERANYFAHDVQAALLAGSRVAGK